MFGQSGATHSVRCRLPNCDKAHKVFNLTLALGLFLRRSLPERRLQRDAVGFNSALGALKWSQALRMARHMMEALGSVLRLVFVLVERLPSQWDWNASLWMTAALCGFVASPRLQGRPTEGG